MKGKLVLTIAFLFFGTFLFAQSAYSLTNVNACRNLNLTNEVYNLTANVSSADYCFHIIANNITLNGNSYRINYSQSAAGYGINNTGGYDNITIKNLNIMQGGTSTTSHAIYGSGMSNSTITNNNITTQSIQGDGIFLGSSSHSNTLSNNNITISGDSGIGIYLQSSNTNTLSNNIITTSNTNGYGIYFSSSSNNTLSNNNITISGSSGDSITLWLSSTNNITGGSVISKARASYYIYGAGTTNNFTNTNFTTLRNITFADATSWFNYNNQTSGDIWLKTNVSAAHSMNRTFVTWSQTNMKWNDTNSTAGIIARYNITGLVANVEYNITNSSKTGSYSQTLTTDSSGNLPSFTVVLNGNTEVKAQANNLPPVWSANATSKPSGTQYSTANNYGFQINWTDADGNFANASFQLGRPSGTLTNYTSFTSPAVFRWNYSNYNNWNYRKQITINGSTSLLNDYQVMINLTNRTASSDNFDFSKALSDGNDTRFTWLNTSSGLEQNISFWIENWTSSGSLGNATLWVKVPNVTASTVANTTIYMYYGNPGATYNNSLGGNNTFLFFDDFSDGTMSDWTTYNGAWSASNYYMRQSTTGIGAYRANHSTASFGRDIIIEARMDNTGNENGIVFSKGFSTCRDCVNGYILYSYSTSVFRMIGDNNNVFQSLFNTAKTVSIATGQWYTYRLAVPSSSNITGTLVETGDTLSWSDSTFSTGGVGVNSWDGTGHSWDDIRVRKYASPEPNVLSVGAEQTTNTWYINFTQTQFGGAGTYNITWFDIDTGGLQNKTDTVGYVINKASTLTRLFLNGTENDRNYIPSQTANFTVMLNINGKTVRLDMNLSGWVLQSGTSPLYNYTQLLSAGIFNITGYFLGDENYSASSVTYYANVRGLIVSITSNLALHLGSAFADDSIETIGSGICISDSGGWFGLTSENPSQAQSGNLTNDYNINVSFTSDSKAFLILSRGNCNNMRRYANDVQLKKFLSPLIAFSYPKANIIQLILQFDSTDITGSAHWGIGTYMLSIANQGYNSSSGKRMLSVNIVK